jgi:hypothetical protein
VRKNGVTFITKAKNPLYHAGERYTISDQTEHYRLNSVPYTDPDRMPSTRAERFEEFNTDCNILSIIKYC